MTASSYPSRPYWQLLALAVAMLLPSLGTSVANVALPTLQMTFGASVGEVQWVVLAYLLATTSLIVPLGRLGDQIGRRSLLLIGIFIFSAASAGAAFASNLGLLITTRALQGGGAAIMMALTLAMVRDVVPKDHAGGAIGLLGTVSAVGTALGPSLGGTLLAWSSWPALFVATATTGTVAFVLAGCILPKGTRRKLNRASFDVPGTLLLVSSLSAFALATTIEGVGSGWLNAGLVALGAGGVAAFIVVEQRTTSPLVRIDLLLDPRLSASLLSLMLVSAIVMTTLVIGPFYLVDALELDPVQTGLVMSIGPAIAALVGLPAGRLVDSVGSSKVTFAGLISVLLGAAMMAVLPTLSGTEGYISSLVFITAGYALFQAANNTGVMAGASEEQRGLVSGLLGMSRNLGLITGASAMSAVYAFGQQGSSKLGLAPGSATGFQLSFVLAAILAFSALLLALQARQARVSAG
jgi:MFS family permease